VRAAIVLLALLAQPPRAVAQPGCDPCVRGEALIDRFGLGDIRPLARQIEGLSLGEPLTTAQYATIVELRKRTPALVKLGALDDTELALVATALCHAPDNACTQATTRALTCLADRCEVAALEPDRRDVGVVDRTCRSKATRKTPVGLGFDWGTGVQDSSAPTDGRVWSLGVEGRWRFDRRWGAVARVDRTAGRDEAVDLDGDGKDDMSTGSITRIAVLAGPSIVLDAGRYERTTRFLRLDVLGGYVSTRSQPGDDGPAFGADLSYQIGMFRLGMRFVQGFAGAGQATMLLGHLGISVGAVPPRGDEDECNPFVRENHTRLALGYDVVLGGYGFDSQLGYLLIGIGLEAVWHIFRRLDAVTRFDLLVFPGGERERVIHQAVLAGPRLDLSKRKRHRRSRTGWYTTALFGHTHGAGFAMTDSGTGPVVDLAVGWGFQDREGAASFRLHGRFGLGEDNSDYRAIFLSAGFELRLDPSRWRDRFRR
jgi:hypothetical protein